MADETPVTPTTAPAPASIPIDTEPQLPVVPIDLNPEYDPAQDKRAPFLKVNPNPTGPTVEAAPEPSVLERAKKVVTEGIPRYSTRTPANPKYGQEQFLAPEEALTPEEQRQHPVATGALEAAGGLTSPATIGTVAATAGVGEAGIIPKVLSGLFAGQIAASVYDQYPALKDAVNRAQTAKTPEEHDDAFSDAQKILTHMGVDTVMGLLAAKHGAEGAKEILDKTTGSGVPDQASTLHAEAPLHEAPSPEETHPEMNRDTVKKLQDLGYSNQHITNFNIGEIRDILKNQTPAAEHAPQTATTAPPEPDKFAAQGGKLVGPQSAETAVSPNAETPAATETDPVEDLLMSDKIGGKKVKGATPKVEPTVLAQRAPDAPKGLVERATGDEQADAAIKSAGAIPAGTSLGMALFHDPKTGSTLAFKPGTKITPEAVQAHLAESRQAFGIKPEPEAFAAQGGKMVGQTPAPTLGDQQDIVSKELRTPFKETYGMEVTHSDGTVAKVKVDAYSPKQAMANIQKKYPESSEWRLDTMPEEKAPSTEYAVPTGELQRMKYSGGQPEVHTIRHELGHVMIGLKEGLTQAGMLSSSHPQVDSNARAAVLWPGRSNDLIDPKTGLMRIEKITSIVRTMMGGIAADEVFNEVPRAANHNFPIDAGGDGTMAYKILRAANMSHDDAMEFMHAAIDDNKEYLSRPEVAGVIRENEGVREADLSRQFHASPQRLTNMHLEAQRRIANGKNQTSTIGVDDNRATGAGGVGIRSANVARTEGGISQTGAAVAPEKGIVSEEKIKKPTADILKAAKLPPQPRLPDTGTYPAIKTDDGGIYFDAHPEGRTHIMFAKEHGVPPERIVSGGWLKDGDYEGSERSDAGRWGEQARAQIQVAAKYTKPAPKKSTK